jgi:hypothetical protein
MAERGLSRHRKAQARRPTKYGVHGNVCPCRRPSRLVTTHALGGRTIRGASEQRIVRDPVRYNLHASCPFAPAAAQACCSARAEKLVPSGGAASSRSRRESSGRARSRAARGSTGWRILAASGRFENSNFRPKPGENAVPDLRVRVRATTAAVGQYKRNLPQLCSSPACGTLATHRNCLTGSVRPRPASRARPPCRRLRRRRRMTRRR